MSKMLELILSSYSNQLYRLAIAKGNLVNTLSMKIEMSAAVWSPSAFNWKIKAKVSNVKQRKKKLQSFKSKLNKTRHILHLLWILPISKDNKSCNRVYMNIYLSGYLSLSLLTPPIPYPHPKILHCTCTYMGITLWKNIKFWILFWTIIKVYHFFIQVQM